VFGIVWYGMVWYDMGIYIARFHYLGPLAGKKSPASYRIVFFLIYSFN